MIEQSRLQKEKLLGRGGEGEVWLVTKGNTQWAAKFYHQPPEKEKAERLAVMVSLATPALSSVSSWPVALIGTGTQVEGVLMPIISGRPLHDLTNPQSRRKHFPDYTLESMLSVGIELTKALEVIHEAGQVVGDLNPNNVMVTPEGKVWLVDTDSFQIKTPQKLYPCEVGMPEYTSPKVTPGSERKSADDLYALGIHLFGLLYGGRHPFAGRWNGKWEKNPPTLETAMQKRIFPYDPGQKYAKPPPETSDLSVLPDTLANFFVEVFSGEDKNAQKTAALLRFCQGQLKVCAEGQHLHFAGKICGGCRRLARKREKTNFNIEKVTAALLQELQQIQEEAYALLQKEQQKESRNTVSIVLACLLSLLQLGLIIMFVNQGNKMEIPLLSKGESQSMLIISAINIIVLVHLVLMPRKESMIRETRKKILEHHQKLSTLQQESLPQLVKRQPELLQIKNELRQEVLRYRNLSRSKA